MPKRSRGRRSAIAAGAQLLLDQGGEIPQGLEVGLVELPRPAVDDAERADGAAISVVEEAMYENDRTSIPSFNVVR